MFQAKSYRNWEITSMKGLGFRLDEGDTIPLPDFTLGAFFERRGLAEADAGADRGVVRLNPEAILDEPVIPSGSTIVDEVNALNAGDIAGLEAIITKYGRQALSEVEVTISGRTGSADAWLQALLARTQVAAEERTEQQSAQREARQDAPQQARGHRQQSAPEQPQSAPGSTPAPTREPAQQRQARAAVDQAKQQAGTPDDFTRQCLMDEVVAHAAILTNGNTRTYVAPLLEGANVKTGTEVPLGRLMAWVIGQRPDVVKALHALGRATEASALEKGGTSVVQWGRDIAGDTARQEQPANA